MTEKETLALTAARDTLLALGYTYEGGMVWRPPAPGPFVLPVLVKMRLHDVMVKQMAPLAADYSHWKNWPGTSAFAGAALKALEQNTHLLKG